VTAEVLATTALVLAVAFISLWLLSLVLRDASIVDIFWGPGFVLVAWTAYVVADAAATRHQLLAVAVTIWGARLGGYLAWRNLGKGEDRRYQAMRRHWGDRFWWVSLFTVFVLQGVIMWVVSLPVQVAMAADGTDTFWPAVTIGAALWAAGLSFETIGDIQLARFKADPANKGMVMDRGLWRYTRHPNYFGDFVVWWGFYLMALGTIDPWWTAVGPALMSFMLLRVSGVAMLERSIGKRRPGYEEYARRTSAFFPRTPRA
jgi:steroid 5-alpha reductase family enzyme